MRNYKKIWAIALGFCVIALLCGVIYYGANHSCDRHIYETNSVEDYGKIEGNYDNGSPKVYMESFFPKQIEDNFQDVNYHYKAVKGDTYAYEIYLEFKLEDSEEFQKYIESLEMNQPLTTFAYDSSFQEYTVSNVFMLTSLPEETASDAKHIGMAKIGKILFSYSEQRVIYIAMGVHDGGGVTTDSLGFFFNQFNIDAEEFEANAYPAVR